mgnify:CR=1 FL=1
MRKYLFILAAGAIGLLSSCSGNGGGMSAAAKKNLDAMHGISNAFKTKDFSKVGDFIAEDAVDHGGDMGDVKGLANIRAQFEKWASSTRDETEETVKELADDDYVMSWLHMKGTYTKDEMGHKAGDMFDMNTLEVSKCKDGKATEHWTFLDVRDMMKMMQAMAPPMDTSKMGPSK